MFTELIINHYFGVCSIPYTCVTSIALDLTCFFSSLFDALKEPLMPTQQLILHCLFLLFPSSFEEYLTPAHLLQLLQTTEGMKLIK